MNQPSITWTSNSNQTVISCRLLS